MSKFVAKRIDIPVDRIRPSPFQPRLTFNLEDIKESIMRDGILVALTVREKDSYYELVDGERRLRAAKELGYKTVPCDVIDMDDDTARRMIWKVNTLRKDYEPKEKALFFKKMHEEYGMSLRGIAREYHTAPNTVRAYLNVFKLPEEYQQMVWDRVIGIGVIQELERFLNSVLYITPETNPEVFKLLDRAAKDKRFGQREIREAVKALNQMNASSATRRVAPKIMRLLEFLKPPKKKLLIIGSYKNTDRLHLIVEKPLYEEVREVVEKLDMTLDAFLQNIIERSTRELKTLKPEEIEALQQAMREKAK